MTDPAALAHDYLALWNDADDETRRKRLAKDWSAQAHYADPLMTADGHEGVAAMIASARARFPGHTFGLRGTPDGHGRFVRFAWSLAPADGAPVAYGSDVVRLDEHDRISDVVGFFDVGVA